MDTTIQPDMAMALKQQQIIADAPLAVCPECGGKFFDEVVVAKKISGLLIGSPNEYEYSHIPVFICHNCHKMAPWVLENPKVKAILGKQFGEEDQPKKQESSLIINS